MIGPFVTKSQMFALCFILAHKKWHNDNNPSMNHKLLAPALDSHPLGCEACGDVRQAPSGAYLHQHLGAAQLLRVLAGASGEVVILKSKCFLVTMLKN